MSELVTGETKQAASAVKAPRPSSPQLLLQRKCACAESAGSACETCGAGRPTLQRRGAYPAAAVGAAGGVPSSVEGVLAAPGRPLDADTRTFMESRFGHDFGGVRVHDDAAAAASAHDVDAHAYTVGRDIVFADNRYRPESESGRGLLAHELAHTIQQEGLQRSGTGSLVDQGPEYRRLEAEADRAADLAMRGAGPPALAGASRPTLSRKGRSLTAGDDVALKKKSSSDFNVVSAYMTTDHHVTADAAFERDDKKGKAVRQESYAVDTLFVPGTKGPAALAAYQSLASGSGLSATLLVDGRTKAMLWQKRDDTSGLQGRWLDGVGWPGGKKADALWQKAGGDSVFPRVGNETCQMDHIVELQVGGNNTNENLQALDAEQNRDSGGAIKNQVFKLAEMVGESLGSGATEQITLRFKAAKPKGSVETPKAGKQTCLKVDAAARAMKTTTAGAAPATVVDYELSAGGAATTLKIEAGFAKSPKARAPIKDDASNHAAAELIPGLLLETLHHGASGHAVEAQIDTRDKTRLPLAIEGKKGTVELRVAKDGKLKLAEENPNLKFTYKYLSPGTITKIAIGAGGAVEWRGQIKPGVPFLGTLDVSYEKGELKVTKGLDPKQIKPPLPGVRLTKAEVSLLLAPEFRPEGTLGFAVGPEKKPLAEGEIKISKDDNGLVARGDLFVHLPGVDKALINVTYSAGAWSGDLTIQSTQIKIPYVESGSLTVRIAPKTGISAEGKVGLGLPGGNKAEVSLARRGDLWVFKGTGTFKLPKLDDAQVSVEYDGDTLIARGKTGFTFHGLRGTLDPITYRAKKGEEGRVTGTGKLDVNKGRVSGNVTVNLLPSGRFSGEGKVTVRINDKLTANAGIKVDENEKVRLSGELRLEVVELFKGIHGDKELFNIEQNIPIPGASIPGVGGLMAKIGGGVSIGYGIGPGVLRDVYISAAFNPLEESPDIEAEMGGKLAIPAYAKISGFIKGGIALDATIAEVSGFLTITVSLALNGGLGAEFKGRYAKNRFVVDAHAEISAALILGLALDATARAKAGVGAISIEKSKTWNLKKLEVPTGLDFKLRAPIHYASDEPFKAPGLDTIEFSPPPRLDPGDLLGRIFKAATATESENQPREQGA